MSPWIFAAVGSAVCIAVVALCLSMRAIRSTRPDAHSDHKSSNANPPSAGLDGVLDIAHLIDPAVLGTVTAEDALVFEQDSDELLVIGTRSQAEKIGRVVGAAKEKILRPGQIASKAVEAGVEALKQFGHLVRIHPDDAKALRLGKMLQKKVPDGYARGVVMRSDGKFVNLARLKSATKLSSVASGAAIVSSLAMQAQLDRIEKKLANIQESVQAVSQKLDDDDKASRKAVDHLLSEVYRVACRKGQLTRAQWEQIAPLAYEVYKLQEKSTIELDNSIEKARTLSSKAKNRRHTLQKLRPELERALQLVNTDDRAAAQFQALRLWHMTCSADPALEETLADTRNQIEQRAKQRDEGLRDLEGIFTSPDVTGRVQQIHVLHRKKIRRSGEHLLALVEKSYLTEPDEPKAVESSSEPPKTPVPGNTEAEKGPEGTT